MYPPVKSHFEKLASEKLLVKRRNFTNFGRSRGAPVPLVMVQFKKENIRKNIYFEKK